MENNVTGNSYIENETKSTLLDTATSEFDVRVSGVVLCSLSSPHESDTQSLYRWVFTSIFILHSFIIPSYMSAISIATFLMFTINMT